MENTKEEYQDEEDKKQVYKETTDQDEELSSGETSSAADLGRSEFSNRPVRKNKPLGSGHEPGVTPGRDF